MMPKRYLFSLLLISGCRLFSAGGASASDPEVLSHVDLGNQHLSSSKWTDAIQSFSVALEKDERNKDALRGSGLAYLELERFEQAKNFYEKTVRLYPDWSLAKNEFGVVLMSMQQCEDAEALFRDVLKDIFYPTPAFAEHNLSRSLHCQGDSRAAVDQLRALTAKRPKFCLGYLSLAEIAYEGGRYADAVQACESFSSECELDPKIGKQILPEYRAKCYLHAGMAHVRGGDVESARAAFRRCKSSGPLGRQCEKQLRLLPN